MPNTLMITLRAASIALLIYIITLFGLVVDSKVFNFWEVANIFGQLRDLATFGFYIILYFVMFLVAMALLQGVLVPVAPSSSLTFASQLVQALFSNMVGRWFYFDEIDTTSPSLSEALGGFSSLGLSMLRDLYMVSLQLIVGIMMIYALRSIITADPSDSIKTIVLLNLLIVIPLFLEQLNRVILMFVSTTPQILQNMLDEQILKASIYADVSDNFGVFLTSDIFQIALACFLYLEFSFQLAYIDKVTSPSLEREERLSRQIDILKEEAERAIQNLKAIEEKKREQRLLEENLKSYEEQLEEKKRLSLRSFMSESGGSAFSYVSELIEKKRKEKEENEMMNAMKDTRKLSYYLEKLFKQDPEARKTLTAKSSAPSASGMLKSTIYSMAIRIFLVVLFSWATIHPRYVFENIFRAPDAIVESVELQTYEGTLSLLIPILLAIPLTATIIRITKHNKLQELLRLEELKREGLTEEELREREQRRARISEEEVQLQRDADAVAQQATPGTP